MDLSVTEEDKRKQKQNYRGESFKMYPHERITYYLGKDKTF